MSFLPVMMGAEAPVVLIKEWVAAGGRGDLSQAAGGGALSQAAAAGSHPEDLQTGGRSRPAADTASPSTAAAAAAEHDDWDMVSDDVDCC